MWSVINMRRADELHKTWTDEPAGLAAFQARLEEQVLEYIPMSREAQTSRNLMRVS